MGKSKKRRHSSSSSDSYEWEVKRSCNDTKDNSESQSSIHQTRAQDDLFAAMLNRVASSKSVPKETLGGRSSGLGWKKNESKDPLKDPEILKRFINGPPKCTEIQPSCVEREHTLGDIRETKVVSSNNSVTEVEERYVTNDDINSMCAQIMKAELIGNNVKIAKLKSKLDKLREAQRRNIKVRLTKTVLASSARSGSARNVVHLTTTDSLGHEVPLQLKQYQSSSLDYHDEQGRRTKYYPDDDEGGTIGDLVLREKLESGKSYDKQFASMAGRCKGIVDDEYDDTFVSKRVKSQNSTGLNTKSDAIAAYKRREYAESSCSSCIHQISRYLIMSVGQRMFLSLPETASLTRGHCILSPLDHVGAMTRVDENAFDETVSFKRDLSRMAELWKGKGASCVFMEVGGYPNHYKHHCQIECFPVDKETMEELPSYFKKALLDLGSEWDQNKRIVNLKKPGLGAYSAIPPNFGYFAVEFGVNGGGYAKIIEDWSSFPLYFGREILAGILSKSPDRWRRPKKDSLEELRKKAVEFEEKWSALEKDSREHDVRTRQSEASEAITEGPALPPSMN
ncbi:unnamed protein product [Rodentolepis nana]|uniref:JmjC domain-containing protein n=1 Tax=Rodentolepis nana TaxID=102285 RepID=A0A0R3TNJ3_RODNA|nr:unnamed protein product [Rodentolepis nana]